MAHASTLPPPTLSTQFAHPVVVGGFTPLPIELTWTIGGCLCASLASTAFIAAAVPCRKFSVIRSPFSLILAQALFEAVFSATMLASFVATEPARVVSLEAYRSSLPAAANTSVSARDAGAATLALCQKWPVIGSLLAASVFGAELCSIFFTFDLRGFSVSPFGKGAQCCRLGLYYAFHPAFCVTAALLAFGAYYGAVGVAAPQEAIGTFPFGTCFASFSASAGRPLQHGAAAAIFLTLYSICSVLSLIGLASMGPALYILSRGPETRSELVANAQVYAQMMEPRRGFIEGFGGALGIQVAVKAATFVCVAIVSVLEFRDTSFTMWGQSTPIGMVPSSARTAFVGALLILWSSRGAVLFVSLCRTPFISFVCCTCHGCNRKDAAELARHSDDAMRALDPTPPHRNDAVNDAIGAMLGEGIGFLAALPPTVQVVGLRQRKFAVPVERTGATTANAETSVGYLVGKSVVLDRGEAAERGTVRFHGDVAFAAGTWVGIELREPSGGNDGTVHGQTYFKCAPEHGVFVQELSIKKIDGVPANEWMQNRSSSQNSRGGPSADARQTKAGDKTNEHREDRACCEKFPIEPILLDQETFLPIYNGGNIVAEDGPKRTRGPRSSKRRPPQIMLRALHEDALRPLRQFFLGSLYCPSEFGLTGNADDPGLSAYLDETRHLRGLELFSNQLRFCRKMTRWYYALRARRWEYFPGTLPSVFRFSSGDHRILVDAISEDEYHAFATMLHAGHVEKDKESYSDYVRNNPETMLPRVVGCYLLQHLGLKYKEYFLVYMNPHPPPTAIKAMYSLDGRCVGRSAPPINFASRVVCQHCGKHYFHGLETASSSHREPPTAHGGSPGAGPDENAWWSRCVHRPVRLCLDNDFDLSMLTDRDTALMQSAQLVSDVEYLRSFGHTFYSVTLTLGKTASVSLEQYLEAEARRARRRRGTMTEDDLAQDAEEAIAAAQGKSSQNTAFEATVNGVLTPVHLGLEDVFCRWDGNLRIYDQSLHKREKAVALLGCFPRVRERLLERELEFQAQGSTIAPGASTSTPASRVELKRREMQRRRMEENMATENDLVHELRNGLQPDAHADRFINRIVHHLFKTVRHSSSPSATPMILKHASATTIGVDGGSDAEENEHEWHSRGDHGTFNADAHLAREWTPMSALEIRRQERRREDAEREAATSAPAEVELVTYGHTANRTGARRTSSADGATPRILMPNSPRKRASTGRYQIGHAVTV